MVFNWSIIASLVHTLPSLEWRRLSPTPKAQRERRREEARRRLLLVKTLPIARLLQDVVT